MVNYSAIVAFDPFCMAGVDEEERDRSENPGMTKAQTAEQKFNLNAAK